jgi:hypothetical protein
MNRWEKGWNILPYTQVQASQFQVHISYFLQKCKKGKPPEKGFALIEKRYHTIYLGMKRVFYRYSKIRE